MCHLVLLSTECFTTEPAQTLASLPRKSPCDHATVSESDIPGTGIASGDGTVTAAEAARAVPSGRLIGSAAMIITDRID